MLNNVITILLFLLVNAAGWYTPAATIVVATMLELLPDVPDSALESYQLLMLAIPIPLWACAALASIGYFFAAAPETRVWLLLAPIYVPAIYLIAVITYFHFI